MQLSQLPLIPCLDGSFRPAASVYFSREVMDQLGLRVHIAEPVDSTAQQALFEWLGVRTAPAAATLVQALLAASQEWKPEPLDESTYIRVINCWQALTESVQSGEIAPDALAELRRQPVIPNGRHVLTVPDEILANDRPELAKQFAEWTPFFLPADVPWLPAAMAAGVRPLSQAVTLAVVDGDEALADTAVQEHIAARSPLLKRLLRAETAAGHIVQAEALQKLKVMTLPGLRVQAQLRLGPQIKVAEPEPVSAKWLHGALYLDSEKQPIPWTAVARELAKAVAPGRNVVGLALGIKEVLATESIAEATAMLDELGYP
jgi:hypothetical protein